MTRARRMLASAVVFVAHVCATRVLAEARPQTPPSVVMVVIDTLRADYLGCYGFDGESSPHIDALCKESVVFTNCFSQAPWTKPSIATLFTGLDPRQHQVTTHRGQYHEAGAEVGREGSVLTDILPEETVTLAEALQAAGFETAAFVANPWIRQMIGFGQGFDVYEDRFAMARTTADTVVDAALAWMAERPAGKPYFAYVHVMDVHDPYVAPAEDVAAVESSRGVQVKKKLYKHQLPKGMVRSLVRTPGGDWAKEDRPERLELQTWRTRYAAGVHAVDRRLAPLFKAVQAQQDSRPTMLMVTSDHGEELFEHGGWAHGASLADHQLHVPLIVRLPGKPKGQRVKSLVGLIDVMPTVLGYLSIAAPKTVAGRDFAAVLKGKGKAPSNREVFATAVKWKPQQDAVRTERHKLIRDGSSKEEQLFDLRADPREQRDVAAKQAEVVADLRARLARHRKDSERKSERKPAKRALDDATNERLRSLGY